VTLIVGIRIGQYQQYLFSIFSTPYSMMNPIRDMDLPSMFAFLGQDSSASDYFKKHGEHKMQIDNRYELLVKEVECTDL
jgi:hypothetical protein